MNFYLHHHKSTETLAIAAKTNDHFPSHMSNMDCSQVVVVNIWLLVPLISNHNCSFFPQVYLFPWDTILLLYINRFLEGDQMTVWYTIFKKSLVEVCKSIAVVMAQYFFFVMYHSKCKKKILHDLFSKDFSLL